MNHTISNSQVTVWCYGVFDNLTTQKTKQTKKTKWRGKNLQVWIHGSKNNAKLHFELHKGFEQRAFDRSGFSEVCLRYLTVGPRDRCEIKYIVKRKLSWLHSCLWVHILPGVLFSAFLLVKSGPGVFVCGREIIIQFPTEKELISTWKMYYTNTTTVTSITYSISWEVIWTPPL